MYNFYLKLTINGRKIEENYLNIDYINSLPPTTVFTGQIPKTKLGKDEYFVMGDNRAQSKDSRSYGPIKLSQIKGIVPEEHIELW